MSHVKEYASLKSYVILKKKEYIILYVILLPQGNSPIYKARVYKR